MTKIERRYVMTGPLTDWDPDFGKPDKILNLDDGSASLRTSQGVTGIFPGTIAYGDNQGKAASLTGLNNDEFDFLVTKHSS
jgi:hypothetical protein